MNNEKKDEEDMVNKTKLSISKSELDEASKKRNNDIKIERQEQNDSDKTSKIKNDCNNKINNSVVVSVKKFVENDNELDEVTKLFRKMIGIDKEDTTSTIVRQFSCQCCNRAWWKRVRIVKQVSKCSRCHAKYDPIPLHLEFGIAEFICQICNHKFYHWCPKNGFSVCKKCNNICSPFKILPKSSNTKEINNQLESSNKSNSTANSNNSINNANNSSSSCNSSTSSGIASSSNSNSTNKYKTFTHKSKYSKFHCKTCHDTNINLSRTIIFRPNLNKEFKFCSVCRKIPYYSERHQSTGSTLASLSTSYQNDLELRFLDDEFDLNSSKRMETCVEEDEISDNEDK